MTQSLLNRFLCCRERFRVYAVEGLRSGQDFNHRMFYGNCWHVCEEALARCDVSKYSRDYFALAELEQYVRKEIQARRTDPKVCEQIEHWWMVCRVQFPEYVRYWSKHKDVTARTPLLQEQPFDVPYRLPSGRTVRLRGKWDSVDLVGKGKDAAVWLQENKTKGDVYEPKLTRQLKFDIQSMFYVIALGVHQRNVKDYLPLLQPNFNATAYAATQFAGVRYNVVRRPLSGGKYSIVRHKPTKSNPAGESKAAYYARLGGLIHEDPGHFFLRFNVPVTPEDVADFRRRFLDPVLEQLCDWWEWVSSPVGSKDPFGLNPGSLVRLQRGGAGLHWQHPFGARNILDEGGATDLDEFVLNGVRAGLKPVETVFPELVQ